ncbi:MAG: IclR family transcriptional regulator [Terriglobales bacterium]
MIRVKESKSAPVGVVIKVLRILEALRDAPYGLQLKDVAAQTALNKSTAYRFLAHLESAGYLYRGDAGIYTIGPNFARLSGATNFRETLRKICRPALQKLWDATGETVNLGVLDGNEVLYVDVIESSHHFRMASQVGSRRPLYCTSLGKALAAHLPSSEVDQLLASVTFERFTPRTIIRRAKFTQELARVRQKGYAMDDQEAVSGARCVAAAIFDAGDKPIAAISASGPITRVPSQRISIFASLVKESAASISVRLLGVSPPVERKPIPHTWTVRES